MSLEELMGIEVTSVAGVAQEWFKTPAAMYVITGEDIRRSGHRSISEALRLVPGMNVARIDANLSAVSARGFNLRFANKLLVLIDGRTVYDPLFAGTFWDVQDALLEDIDRIEVIRGPGATLWGANAVNGVINVTNKSAKHTQGLYLTGGGGNKERGLAGVRYGGTLGEDSYYRVWGKYFLRDHFEDPSGNSRPDDWDLFHGGFRVDLGDTQNTKLTLQSEAYNTHRIGEGVKIPIPGHLTFNNVVGDGRANGGHVLARMTHEADSGAGWSLQGYYDRTNRVAGGEFEARRDTFDLDFRHHFLVGQHHDIIWGLGYRHTRDRTQASSSLIFIPADRSADTFSGFIQDTITLIPDELFVMVGSKFEDNDYTDFEFQPSGRLAWTPSDRQTIWASVSRPVRVPNRSTSDLLLISAYADTGLLGGGPPSGVFVPLAITGDPGVDSEELTAYELGYRVKFTDNLSFDAAGFYNDYRKLVGTPASGVGQLSNRGSAQTYGLELSTTWHAASNWKIVANYSALNVHIKGDLGLGTVGDQPHHTASVASYLDLHEDLEFNTALYWVDSVPSQGAAAYWRLDMGFTWRPTERLELAVWGQNLLDSSHREVNDLFFQSSPTEVERGVYVQATLRF